MPKKIRNTLLFFGIVLSALLLFLRVEGRLSALSSGLVMFPQVLGYDGTKSYAVFLFDPEHKPLLFLFTVSKGDVEFRSVGQADAMLKNVKRSDFVTTANVLIERIISSKSLDAVDAVGFVTTSAVGEAVDAFGGVAIHGQQIDSHNFRTIVWEIALSKNAENEFNNSISFSKSNLITHNRSVLFAAKDIFSKGLAAVYFKGSGPFGKACVGACGTQMFDYFNSGVSVNP